MTNASNLKSDNKNDSQDSASVIRVEASQQSVCCPPIDQAQWNQHPRVYLDVTENGQAKCPYCGNKFIKAD